MATEGKNESEQATKNTTMVLYNPPVLVTKRPERKTHSMDRTGYAGTLSESKKETEEILNSILPPICWEEGGKMWTQTISTTPATRQDIIHLQEKLDTRLQTSHAKETGICPIRRALYGQALDEIIRQVTINCAERGLLLLRIRDDNDMTLNSYETLYCSSVAYGLRKSLQAHQEKEILRERIKELEGEKEVLEVIIEELKQKVDDLEQVNVDTIAWEEKKYAEEINFLKKTNQQLKNQLESLTNPKK